MLGGPTDEHRFVGLMLLPKILERSNDPLAEGAVHRQAAFDALDLQFVGRLLTSGSGENAAQMRAVALAVLSVFAGEPQFSAAAASLAKCLVTALSAEAMVEHPDLKIAEDVHGTLRGVALSAEASLALTQAGGTAAAFKLLVALDGAAMQDAAPIANGIGRCVHVILDIAAACDSPEHQTQVWGANAEETVALIGTTLGSSNSLLKFVALDLFAPALLLLQNASLATQSPVHSAWVAEARNGLCSILSARIGVSERYAALLAVATLCDHLGPTDWLFQDQDGKAPLSQLVMRLVSVELQLLLEDDRTSIASSASGTTGESVAPSDMLSVCLRLAEIAVLHAQSLPAADDVPSTTNEGKEGEKPLDAAEQAMELAAACVRSVAQWLARLMSHEQTLTPLLTAVSLTGAEEQPQGMADSLQPGAEATLRQQQERRVALLLGGVRLVGCWSVAAEPQLEIARIFPFLLREVWEEGAESKGASETELPLLQPSEQSAFDFLYPALLQMSIASPTSRQWLFSNPPQDFLATGDTEGVGADQSVAALVAMQVVRSGGDLERRRLEFLLNLLCLEHADGIPTAVGLALGQAAKALITALESRSEELSVDVALAMAFVAGTVRLLRDTRNVSSDELRRLSANGCETTVRWVVVSYAKVVKIIQECSGGAVEADEEANEIPELWSLTCGILCSLSDKPVGTASDDHATVVASALRECASNCQHPLSSAQAAAHKECRRGAQDAEEDADGPATTSFSVARLLLDLAKCLE